MSANRPEQRGAGQLVAELNRLDRDERSRLQDALGQVQLAPTDAFTEPRLVDNRLLLLSGDHGGGFIRAPRTQLTGQPGANIIRLYRVDADATFNAITFSSSPGSNSAAALVEVLDATAVVRFINCTFSKHASHNATCVTLVAGASAAFTGCEFRGGNGTTGNPITNAGLAADCGVMGGSNTTGRPHTNTTVVFEL